MVYVKDREGRMLMANRGTTALIGKPPEDYLGKTDAEFLDDRAQAEIVMANDRSIMEAGETPAGRGGGPDAGRHAGDLAVDQGAASERGRARSLA